MVSFNDDRMIQRPSVTGIELDFARHKGAETSDLYTGPLAAGLNRVMRFSQPEHSHGIASFSPR